MNWDKGTAYASSLEMTLTCSELKQIKDSGGLLVDTGTYTKKGIEKSKEETLPLSYYVQLMNRNIIKATEDEKKYRRVRDSLPYTINSVDSEFFEWKQYLRIRFNKEFWGKTTFTGKRGLWWYFRSEKYKNIQIKRITDGSMYLFVDYSKIREIIRFLDKESKFFYIEEIYDETFGKGIKLDSPVETLEPIVVNPRFILDQDEIEELNKMHLD